jgi:hypothetical protein
LCEGLKPGLAEFGGWLLASFALLQLDFIEVSSGGLASWKNILGGWNLDDDCTGITTE